MAVKDLLKNKKFIIILSAIMALVVAVSGTLCYFLIFRKSDNGSGKKKNIIILTEEEIENSDDILEDIDFDDFDDIGFVDEEDFDDIATEKILTLKNTVSVNDKFMGFGAIYYPWIYWNDDAGRNYTEEQRQIELNRLADSGITWIRTMIYARSEWYNKNENKWTYSGEHYDGLVKFLKEIEKRGIDVLINYEWGGAIQPDAKGNMTIFNDSTLNRIGTMDDRIEMYANFCTTFTQSLKNAGINCVKYVTFFS